LGLALSLKKYYIGGGLGVAASTDRVQGVLDNSTGTSTHKFYIYSFSSADAYN